ncbi:MAG: NAD(P)/FAD-dependent oxidoreductase [Ignavibacteria bacterium]
MKTADVLIIGGGIIGASAAYHLASSGCKNIIVIDKGKEPGEGSTGKATGGFRCQFSTEVNIHLSLLSRKKFLRFEEELGIDSGYRQYGYLFIAKSEKELITLQSARHLQKKLGLEEAREVNPDEILSLNPAVLINGIIGGVFCPTDGFISPMNILHGYMQGAERLGVLFKFGVDCQGFTVRKNNEHSPAIITEVITSEGTISVKNVINAAGAWAGLIAKKAGVEIPVVPARRHVAVLQEINLLPDTMPMTIFTEDGFHFRVRDGQVLLLMPTDMPSSNPFDIKVNDTWIENVKSIADSRVPCLSRTAIAHEQCWAGLYEMTPDRHAILGKAPGFENFYLVNGSSGHGVMHSPALGQLISEIILEGKAKSIDIHALRPSRFAEGEMNKEAGIL